MAIEGAKDNCMAAVEGTKGDPMDSEDQKPVRKGPGIARKESCS